MMITLDAFNTKTRANAGVEVELRLLANGAPSGVFIKIMGTDSEVFREIQEERERAAAERIASGQSANLTRDERTKLTCEALARCTVGWRNLMQSDGSPLEFSHNAAFQLYLDYPAIRDQINEEMAKRANFVLA